MHNPENVCDFCGAPYISRGPRQRYCSKSCAKRAHWARLRARARMQPDRLFGAHVNGCDALCPHWERCWYQTMRPGRAEDHAVGCMVEMAEIDAWAARLDADPGYRAWLAARQRAEEAA